MDEVKIWSVDGDSNVEPLVRKGQTDTEALLEETLVKNPDMLIPGLRLVGRQTPTEGGPLDLLGVDENGRLVVFELKRGTLSRDAVAQIIDYASDLDSKSDVELAEHITAHSGVGGIESIDDFEEWYSQNTEADGLESLRPMRMFLIGLGADDRTERMVRFLAENSGMDMSLLTFHGFDYNGKTLLAKQVEVEAVADTGPRRRGRYVTTAERRERLARRIEDSGMTETFDAVRGMFREAWPRSTTRPGAYGLGIRLQGKGQYARIDPEVGGVRVVFFPRAKALCLDEFRQPVEEFRYDTWPRDREPLEDPDTEIQFKFTAEEWENHKDRLNALTEAVYEAWESSGQEEGSS